MNEKFVVEEILSFYKRYEQEDPAYAALCLNLWRGLSEKAGEQLRKAYGLAVRKIDGERR